MKFQNKLVIKPTNVKLSVYNVQYILHKVLGQLPPTKIASTLIPTLTLNQTLTLTGGQFSSWEIGRTPLGMIS